LPLGDAENLFDGAEVLTGATGAGDAPEALAEGATLEDAVAGALLLGEVAGLVVAKGTEEPMLGAFTVGESTLGAEETSGAVETGETARGTGAPTAGATLETVDET